MSYNNLYPEIAPFNTGTFRPDDRHEIRYEECGRPDGIPVIFLHGGPGGGFGPVHRRFFDPAAYRIILFDQRGCGQSRPAADLTDNTTWHLVSDMEQLRETLGVEKWLVFGGSWGSTLALAYGETHPDRCLGFVLRGIFLGTYNEIDWFMHGMGRVFPEAGKSFREHLPENERGALLANYYKRLTDPDPAIHMPAGRIWRDYENACATLLPNGESGVEDDDQTSLNLSRLEAHYFVHGNFLKPDQLIGNLDRISHLPVDIIQGQYDMICLAECAVRLADSWPGARLHMIADAGHSAMEPGTRRALVAATDRFRDELEPRFP